MDKYLYHTMTNDNYLGIVTILDYEIRLNAYLSDLIFPAVSKGKKAIVDLALKSGVDKYRFVSFDVDSNGRIILNSHRYIEVSKEIEQHANIILQEKKEYVLRSFLTDSQKQTILS